MNRKLLFIWLVLFLALAAALFWQLMRNAEGDDPDDPRAGADWQTAAGISARSAEYPGRQSTDAD